MKVNVVQLVNQTKEKLISGCSSEHEAQQQAWWLIEEITKKTEEQLLIKGQVDFSTSDKNILDCWIKQRVFEKKPVQYILGHVSFCDLDIFVKQPILIPRPETEEWVYWLLAKLAPLKHEKLKILDIGCGSGCISLALAKALPQAQVFGVDINLQAITLSEENKIHNNIDNVFFVQSNFYDAVGSDLKFDLIVSNPPYISDEEWKTISDTVRLWEDYRALVAAKKGFMAFEKIIVGSRGYLNENSRLKESDIPQIVLEIGRGQEDEVEMLLKKQHFKNISIFKDMEGVNRWITGGF